MRKEPLIFEAISNSWQDNPDYTIPGLDIIEPFGSTQWDTFSIYTTESLYNVKLYSNRIGNYVYHSHDGKIIYVVNGKCGCLDSFVALMSEEEQAQFYLNFPDIAELLKL